MKRAGIFGFVLLFLTIAVYANGPTNKVTGSFIRGMAAPNFAIELTAHESIVMANGKTRPAKGMVTAYHLTNTSRTPDVIEAMNFCETPPVGPEELNKHWTVFEGNIQIHSSDTD
jgi:hypothetical protein